MRSRTPRTRLRRIVRLARANLYDFRVLLVETRFVLITFALLATVTSLYLLFGYPATAASPRPRDVGEALYATVQLMSLQSGLAFPAGDLLGVFVFFFTPLLGLALIFQSVLNFGRLVLDKAGRVEQWQVSLASTYREHVIVCGLGRVGWRTAQQLAEAGYEVVVIEREWGGEFVAATLAQRIPVVHGDARVRRVLQQAGIAHARAIICAIADDLVNIEIGLNARNEHPTVRLVLRIFNEDLDRNVERALGKNTCFSASALAAPTIAAAAVSREVDYVIPVAGHLLGISKLIIQPDSSFANFIHTVEQRAAIRVIDHQSADGRPQSSQQLTRLSTGDRVAVVGELAELERVRLANMRDTSLAFLGVAQLQHPTEEHNAVIVCGLGRVGYRVVRQLYALERRPRIIVVRLDDAINSFAERVARLPDVTTIIGDARDVSVLRRAGLNEAFSVVAATSDDLVNLQVGLAARSHRANVHIVMRTFSDALAERLAELFGIRTTFSTSALAAPTLAAAAVARSKSVGHAFFIGGRLFGADTVAIGPSHPFIGRTVDQVRAALNIQIIALRRGNSWRYIPGDHDHVELDDQMTMIGPLDALDQLPIS